MTARPTHIRPVHRQVIPQVIMAGRDITALEREELKDLVVHGDVTSPVYDALVAVAFLVDGAKRDEDFVHTGIWEDGRELTFAELEAEGVL